ncbi:MAG: TonB family protein [Bacteroidota bacterium]
MSLPEHSSNAPHRMYIEHLKAQEKKKKRRKLGAILLGSLVLFGGGMAAYSFLGTSQETTSYYTYAPEELSLGKVNWLLSTTEGKLVISDPSIGLLDTINSSEDYLTFRAEWEALKGGESTPTFPDDQPEAGVALEEEGSIDLVNQADEEPTTELVANREPEVEPKPSPKPNYSLKGTSFIVEGDPYQDEVLKFTIRNYRPENTYTLDLGNGIRRRIRRTFTYAYPKTGRYTMILTASDPDNRKASIQKYHEIFPPKREMITAAPQTRTTVPARQVETPPKSEPNPASSSSNTSAQPSVTPRTPVIEDKTPATTKPSSQPVNRPKPEPKPATPTNNRPQETVDTTTPQISADVMPSFPGGESAMFRFLNSQIRYPRAAIDYEVEGRVYVQFVVDPQGNIINPTVVRGISYGCDEEALRIIGLMPKWVPGSKGGQRIPVIYTLPVTFDLEEVFK